MQSLAFQNRTLSPFSMNYRKTRYYLNVLLFVLLLGYLSGCDKFSGDQTVPAYLSIDSITLQVNDPGVEGSASHNITDAWVYVDDVALGAYQLPACFPILNQGTHTITVLAGIKRDGIASTRVTYPFYAQIEKSVTLTAGDTVSVKLLKTSYLSTSSFIWKENFEGLTLSLDTTVRSQAALTTTDVTSPLTFEGAHSGLIKLDTANSFFEVVSHNQFPIPINRPIYMELNFNTNVPFTVGAFIYGTGSLIYQVPILTLVPTNGVWKKIYIDLSVTLNAYPGMDSFRVYFANFLGQSISDGTVLLDNIKVITRQ